MSQIAETYVTIRPRLSDNFEGDLRTQIQKDVTAASQKAGVGVVRPQVAPNTLQQTAGLNAAKQGERELAAASVALAAAEADLTTKNDHLAASHDRVAIHAHRSQIAGFTLRGSTLGIGAAAVIGAQGLVKLSEALRTAGDEAETTQGRLKNVAADLLSGHFADAAQRVGDVAALNLQPGARGAQADAIAATKRDEAVQKSIALAAEFVRVRREATKATGEQGTAEGVVKFQLEQQLRLLRSQVGALPKDLNRIGFAQLGLGPNGTSNQNVIDRNKGAARPTDLDFQLQAAKASATKTTTDDLELFRSRRQFLTGLVHRTEAANADTVEAKTNLKRLYGLLSDADGQVVALQKESLAARQEKLQTRISLQQTELQIQEANARTDGQEITALRAEQALATKSSGNKLLDKQARAGFALQAAQLDKQVFDINTAAAEEAKRNAEALARQREQDRKEALAKLKARREEAVQLRELRLQNAISAAGLTKRTSDDKKAIKAEIAYFKNLVATRKGLEREQARSSLIAAKSQLQGLQGQTAGGATTAEFFKQAASQFNEFGSNIAGRNGVLSGQDARGQFAGIALSGQSPMTVVAAGIRKLGDLAQPQLTESQKQTLLLERIADGVRRFGVPGAIKDRTAINIARSHATFLGSI